MRAIDVDFTARMLDVNGTWVVRRAASPGARRQGFRKLTTKNKLRRQTPFAESRRESLLVDCRAALGLPVDALRRRWWLPSRPSGPAGPS